MSKPIGILHSALFVLTWSSGFVGVRLASDSAPPETVLMWRSVVLTLALSPWLLGAVRRLPWRELRREALVGVLSQVIYLASVYWAIDLGVSSGTTALMDGLQPLVVAALAGPVLGGVVASRQWWGLVLGLAGVAVVSYADVSSPSSSAPWWAYGVPLVGMLGLVAATFLDRSSPRQARPLEALAVHVAVTASLSTAAASALGGATPVATTDFWFAVAWLAVLATGGGYGLYWLLLERRGVTQVNSLLFLVAAGDGGLGGGVVRRAAGPGDPGRARGHTGRRSPREPGARRRRQGPGAGAGDRGHPLSSSRRGGLPSMIIVSGKLVVQPGVREDYLASCVEVVRRARAAPGCLDFAISPDLLDPERVNVLELWTDPDRLAAFRGEGIGEDQGALLVSVAVAEHSVAG